MNAAAGAVAFPFGKLKGRTIAEAIGGHLAYCTWCLTLSKVAQRHPEFVTRLRRAVAEAQLREAEAEERSRADAAVRALRGRDDVSDLL